MGAEMIMEDEWSQYVEFNGRMYRPYSSAAGRVVRLSSDFEIHNAYLGMTQMKEIEVIY